MSHLVYAYDGAMIFFLAVVPLYMLPLLVCFFLNRNEPAIATRSPFLVMLSCFGIISYIIINSIAPLLRFSDTNSLQNAWLICIGDRFRMLTSELLIIFPYGIRALKILKAKNIITKLRGRSRF